MRGRRVVGVISDTHGLVRPEALRALDGSELIVHAGDIGSPEVIAALERIAPVSAVRGNNDREQWAAAIPETEVVEVALLWCRRHNARSCRTARQFVDDLAQDTSGR